MSFNVNSCSIVLVFWFGCTQPDLGDGKLDRIHATIEENGQVPYMIEYLYKYDASGRLITINYNDPNIQTGLDLSVEYHSDSISVTYSNRWWDQNGTLVIYYHGDKVDSVARFFESYTLGERWTYSAFSHEPTRIVENKTIVWTLNDKNQVIKRGSETYYYDDMVNPLANSFIRFGLTTVPTSDPFLTPIKQGNNRVQSHIEFKYHKNGLPEKAIFKTSKVNRTYYYEY